MGNLGQMLNIKQTSITPKYSHSYLTVHLSAGFTVLQAGGTSFSPRQKLHTH